MSSNTTYKDAGVDIEAADHLVRSFADIAKQTHTAEVVSGKPAYAGLMQLNTNGMQNPLLAATCDGVGTKLIIAEKMNDYSGLGQDLVAMNVNDLLPMGARPLFFLDYIATGKLDPASLRQTVESIGQACQQCGCALLGGETAEMPDVYRGKEMDLAGFAVGLVDANNVPEPNSVCAGDIILALPSSGIHSNGLSLARKALIENAKLDLQQTPAGLTASLGHTLLEPTALYVNEVLALMQQVRIKAAAHITGGGLLGRLEPISREGLRLFVNPESYQRPAIFDLIAQSGPVSPTEMARTFNMGLGFVVVVDAAAARNIMQMPENPWLSVGHVKEGTQGVDLGYACS